MKYPLADALTVAQEVGAFLGRGCEQIGIAGSIRRKRPEVSDVEIVYVPAFGERPNLTDFFAGPIQVNLAEEVIAALLSRGNLVPRLNSAGRKTMGPENKLLTHVASGIPVDLFATTHDCLQNYFVCRTGGTETNVRICQAAIARGKHWLPYGTGFREPDGQITPMHSEREVFEHVGLKHLEPEDRP